MSVRHNRRLDRQFGALSGRSPLLRRIGTNIQGPSGVLLRLPLGPLLVAGGLPAILPFFGLWMIPLGLLVLAIDLPPLRRFVSTATIRVRRKWTIWKRNPRSLAKFNKQAR